MRIGLAAAAFLAVVGCGAADVPSQQLTSAKSAIRGAVEAGAKGVPKGALHLKMARDQVDEAEVLIDKHKELDKAKHLLVKAEADANLAVVLAKEANAVEERADAKRQLKSLEKEKE